MEGLLSMQNGRGEGTEAKEAGKQHAAFCQSQFTLDLFWRIRLWKQQGRPRKR